MSDATEHLIEAALRPLSGNSNSHQAGAKLLGEIASNPPTEAAAKTMIARWDEIDAQKYRPLWRWALAGTLLLLSAWVLTRAVNEAITYRWAMGLVGPFGTDRQQLAEKLICAGLGDREQLWLFGDLSKPSDSERMRVLWDHAPDDPANYAEYAFLYQAEHSEYPPDFPATTKRLDPENSWFTYNAAGALAKDSIKKEKQTYQSKKAGEAPAWKVMDEARLNQALGLLQEASRQKQFVNRQKEFMAGRIPLLPQSDQVSRLASCSYVSKYSGNDFNMKYLADAIAAKASLLGETGDAAGFKELLVEAKAFLKVFGEAKTPTLIDALIFKANASKLICNFQAAAEKLGLGEEANRLKKININLGQWSENLKNQTNDDKMALRSSVLAGSIDSMRNLVNSPPPLSDDELKPGRMIEHLMASRVCLLAIYAIFCVGILAIALFRFCLPGWMLLLAQRINALLFPVDWAWMLGAGVLLPFGFVTALSRYTPLGGQDWGLIQGGAIVLVATEFLTMALLMLVTPLLIARWRIGRRAAALGIGIGTSRLSWLAVAAGILFVPVLGMDNPPILWPVHHLMLKLALLVPLLLVILISLVRALALKFTRQFSSSLVALTLIPTYASGMLMITILMAIYGTEQARWERHDPLTELTQNGFTGYEGAVAKQLLQETRELLKLDAKDSQARPCP